MSVHAVAKGVRISPRKVSVVASLVRGRSVEDALVILNHTPRRSAVAVRKAIESARANADHNHNLKPATLQIIEISVTPGPRLKRYRPISHGRAHPFHRATSHIRVVVDGEQRPKPTPKSSKTPTDAKRTVATSEPKKNEEAK
ncbi:MAG TPA: 50S ribosomal protein L22 [Candidatus Saccharimonadales bacterium]|nr:50S ribosomal protein L22 [Candidatus Saccharimonadales bacterium]